MNTNLSIQKRLVSSIREYVKNQDLMHQEGRYLVALSGGSDSVCMLLILKELGFSIEAIHCNFHLRGEESDRDEQFCVDLCNRMNVNLHRIHFERNMHRLTASALRWRQGICGIPFSVNSTTTSIQMVFAWLTTKTTWWKR